MNGRSLQLMQAFLRMNAHAGWPLVITVLLGGCTAREARMSMQKIGPLESIVGQPAEFKITVNNVGDGSAADVTVRDTIPEGMSYVASSPAGRYDPARRVVQWELGTLGPGAGTTLGITVRGDAKGERCNQAVVEASEGSARGTARSCTVVAGAADLKVSLLASPDPGEVGFTITYTVDVRNEGSETASNVRVRARVPAGVAYLTSSGPTPSRVSGNEVSFAPMPALPPGASMPYKLVGRAQRSGSKSFEAQVTADHLSGPIVVEKMAQVGGAPGSRGTAEAQTVQPAGMTRMEAKDRIKRSVSVENVLVRGRAVTGRVVNRSSRRLRNVYLAIRSVWLWDDEFNPGEGDPSSSTRYRVPGEVPAGGFLSFVYRPLPLPPRTDGRYETRVSIAEFSEVP